MSGSWSQQIEKRYHLCLPEDLRDWFDQEIWRRPGGAEFCQAQSPLQLIDPDPGVVWAGFMMPNTLPLIGNGYGDWLCLRVAWDGSIQEILHWSHGGGDWLPYGSSLAESLLYDAAASLLFPRRPEFTEPKPPDEQTFRLAEWARSWLRKRGTPCQRFWPRDAPVSQNHHDLLNLLLQADVAEIPVRRDRVAAHLNNPMRINSDTRLADRFAVPWEPDFVHWLFDATVIPHTVRERLVSHFGLEAERLFRQDWPAAEQEATAVIRQRSDIGWAFDIAGWQAERSGDLPRAARYYLAGTRTSLFSDATVCFRTHWFDQNFGKFSAARLAAIADVLTQQQRTDPYLQIYWQQDAATLKDRLSQYWLTRARSAEQRGEHQVAYAGYYQAGWDLGLSSMDDYREVLDGLSRTAAAGGSPALAAVAQLHLGCL